MNKHLALLGLFCLSLAACAPDTGEMEAEASFESVTAALTDLRDSYAEAMMAGDPGALAALYAEDAVYMPGSGIRVVGREAIEQSLTGLLGAVSDVEIVSDASEIIGNWAIERGRYSLAMAPESMEAFEQGGYYISVSHMQPDGSLKLAWLASNYDSPPAMPSPPDMAPAPMPAPGADAALEGLRSAWESEYNAGNAEAVAALYTEDAVAMFAEQAAVEGPGAIRASLEAMNELAPTVSITAEGSERIGDWMVGRGTHTMTVMSPEGDEMALSGFHLVVCRQDTDGQWKIHWHIGTNYRPVIG